MSTTYEAVAIIGSRVEKSKILQEGIVPGCEHVISYKDGKFCPECGRRAFRNGIIPIDGFIGVHDRSNGYSTLSGLKVFFSRNNDSIWVAGHSVIVSSDVVGNDYNHRIASLYANGSDSHCLYDNARSKVRIVLQQLGLWNSELFGIWLIML